MKDLRIKRKLLHVLGSACFLSSLTVIGSGCAMMVASVATDAVTSATKNVVTAAAENRDDYTQLKQSIDARMQQIPIEATYDADYDRVWDAVMVNLRENQEVIGQTDMTKGHIQTGERAWDQHLVSALEAEFGIKAASEPGLFAKMEKSLQGYLNHDPVRYIYNVQIDKTKEGASVRAEIVFSGNITAASSGSLPIPERCALLRSRFFKTLDRKIEPVYVKLPDNPLENVPYNNTGNRRARNRIEKQGQTPNAPGDIHQ